MKTEQIINRVREWLFRGIAGPPPYPAAISQAQANGVADIHLDVLLTERSLEDYQWKWEQALAVFKILGDLLRDIPNIYAQMVIYLNPFDNLLNAHDLNQLLTHASNNPPNFYVLRRDWRAVPNEELHRYPLESNVVNASSGKYRLFYEISRPTCAKNDPGEYYYVLIMYWYPQDAE